MHIDNKLYVPKKGLKILLSIYFSFSPVMILLFVFHSYALSVQQRDVCNKTQFLPIPDNREEIHANADEEA
jgi:hypothetical protein